jgi:cytochrome c2
MRLFPNPSLAPLRNLAAWLGLALLLALAPATSGAAPLKAEDILVANKCGGCHTIPGVPGANGKVGPNLTGLSKRPRIAGDKLSNTRENLRRWLKDPASVKVTMMPSFKFSKAELDVLVPFLDNL